MMITQWFKRLLFGRPDTEDERQERRRAKMLMLGAGAGAAMAADSDGVVRVEDCHGDDEVRADSES